MARYDRTGWRIFTAREALVDRVHRQTQYLQRYWPILETRDGAIWLLGQHEGKAAVSRFDGRVWTRYTEADGLAGELVSRGYEATDGTLWFGTWRPYAGKGDGLFRFDGKSWTRYTEADGLSSSLVSSMTEWPAGTLWMGTLAGINRLDLSSKAEKQAWWSKTDFPVERPDIGGFVPLEDALWFNFSPYRSGGVVRYDGKEWRIYTETDGMASAAVNRIIRASDKALWFAGPGGISRFDGENWIGYKEKDGPSVRGSRATIREASDGSFWIEDGEGKVIRFLYRSGQAPPETFLEPAPEKVSSAGNILLRWSGRDLWDDTPLREMRYQWRMDGGAWSP